MTMMSLPPYTVHLRMFSLGLVAIHFSLKLVRAFLDMLAAMEESLAKPG